MLEQLSNLQITCDKIPELITEPVQWHHAGHTFTRSLFAGGWLQRCPACTKKQSCAAAGEARWNKWRKENPNKKWTHTEDAKTKIKNTVKEKYGVDNVAQIETVKAAAQQTFRRSYIETTVPLLLKNIEMNFDVVPAEVHHYSDSGKKHKWLHRKCGHEFYHYLNYAGLPACPNCKPKSNPEQELFEFVSSVVATVRGTRTLLSPTKKEIDIWLPEYRLGIEMNGVYWHSDKMANSSLKEKTDLATANGISLVHIWDYEWITKQQIVKNIILSKLGKTSRIFARECKIKELPSDEARDFFMNNHIHGAGNRLTVNIALEHRNQVVMVMTFGKPRFSKNTEWEIIRSCSRIGNTVVGGLSKCLAYFRERHPGKIISYADRRLFDGASYEKLGFKFIAVRAPNYQYVKGTKVLSRIECQKHKLPQLLGEKFDPALTEEQNMIANNWLKISDCGVSTWILD